MSSDFCFTDREALSGVLLTVCLPSWRAQIHLRPGGTVPHDRASQYGLQGTASALLVPCARWACGRSGTAGTSFLTRTLRAPEARGAGHHPESAAMATATCKPLALEPGNQSAPSPPLRFFYSHFHDSIRSELDALSQSVLGLDSGADQRLLDRLLVLKERYQFLEQVYNYHSSVEDEVNCPTAAR